MPAYFVVRDDRRDENSGDIVIEKVPPGAVVPKQWQSVPREYGGDDFDDSIIILVFEEGTLGAHVCELFMYIEKLRGLSFDAEQPLAEYTRAVWDAAVAFQKR